MSASAKYCGLITRDFDHIGVPEASQVFVYYNVLAISLPAVLLVRIFFSVKSEILAGWKICCVTYGGVEIADGKVLEPDSFSVAWQIGKGGFFHFFMPVKNLHHKFVLTKS